MSSQSTSSSVGSVTTEVVSAVGGGCGAGGCSGSPAKTETLRAQTSANVESSLFTGLPPFLKVSERDNIQANAPDLQPLFAQFWQLHCANEPTEALAVCDRILEALDPADFLSHLRQANARAMSLRTLKRYREAYTVQMAARPFLAAADAKARADYLHGLGLSLKWMGEHVRAYKALDGAMRLYQDAGERERAARTAVNIARLYATSGHASTAHGLLDTLGRTADTEIARALAYEAESDVRGARKAIASALGLLADSSDEATRAEALEVLSRIEGGAR